MEIKTMFKIYDAMMGSGKSTKLIEEIKNSKQNESFMVITPLLDECHRFAGTMYDPEDSNKKPLKADENEKHVSYLYKDDSPLKLKRFKHPEYKGGNKAESLEYLLKYKENIVSTHQLFTNLTPKMLEHAKDYTLVIDETLQVYDVFADYSKLELDRLFSKKLLSLDEDKITLRFNKSNFGRDDESVEGTRYEALSAMCDLGQLLYIRGTIVIWELSIDTLKCFKEVWIATYMFEGSQMSAYLKTHNVKYELIKFGNKPSEIKSLINVFEPNSDKSINAIGKHINALSSNQFRTKSKEISEQLSKNLDNFFRNKVKAKKDDRLWTTFKPQKTSVGSARYKDEWLAFNTKATNEYGHIHNLAYLMNLYTQPHVAEASAKRGNPIDEDVFALSEMVQWIWRSAIRNGEEINIYIPSKRMRTLLIRWLNDEFETTNQE